MCLWFVMLMWYHTRAGCLLAYRIGSATPLGQKCRKLIHAALSWGTEGVNLFLDRERCLWFLPRLQVCRACQVPSATGSITEPVAIRTRSARAGSTVGQSVQMRCTISLQSFHQPNKLQHLPVISVGSPKCQQAHENELKTLVSYFVCVYSRWTSFCTWLIWVVMTEWWHVYISVESKTSLHVRYIHCFRTI